MDKIINASIIFAIAISYNLFVHHLASMLYRETPYEEKYNKTITFVFISGIIGIILSKLLLKKGQTYHDSVVSMGLGIGGVLLIITSILANWTNMSDDIKLCISALMFGGLIWYFYHYYDNNKENPKITQNDELDIEDFE